MPHVIVTGGPGVGKTTLLSELSRMGYGTVDDSARAIIAERMARGETPRPDLATFAREILRRDIEKYRRQPPTPEWVFFDRGVIDALGFLHEVAPLAPSQLHATLASYPFHPCAFVLPPWQAIYRPDAERDQSFADALVVHERIVRWYRSCGYRLQEVPCVSVSERADHVLRVL
jgi:predicted ATPase